MIYFQVMLCISFLIVLLVISRLYNAIRILNARVTLLSSLLREVRLQLREDKEEQDSHEQATFELEKEDSNLRQKLGQDFLYKHSRSLLRVYEDESPNMKVSMKTDMSYLGTGRQSEQVSLALDLGENEDEKQEELQAEGSKEK